MRLSAIVVSSAAVVLASAAFAFQSAQAPALVGKSAPKFSTKATDGKTYSLDNVGKKAPMIMVFWKNPEIVEESGGGIVYSTNDELITALDRLSVDASYQRELGLSAYSAFQQKWTTEAHLQRYFALINEIAATRGQPVG